MRSGATGRWSSHDRLFLPAAHSHGLLARLLPWASLAARPAVPAASLAAARPGIRGAPLGALARSDRARTSPEARFAPHGESDVERGEDLLGGKPASPLLARSSAQTGVQMGFGTQQLSFVTTRLDSRRRSAGLGKKRCPGPLRSAAADPRVGPRLRPPAGPAALPTSQAGIAAEPCEAERVSESE